MKIFKSMSDSTVMLIICMLVLFLIIFVTNMFSHDDWNDGKCPNCNVRYELQGVGGYGLDIKYYQCPKCGREVKRY